MKALCVEEIDNLVEDFRALVGSRLQKIYSGQNDLVFEFYGKRREGWLWLDLHPQRPFIGLMR
ncbi:MAG: hypothetical protein KDD35_04210, partial [Bdellovibrionales bacterium]|nr:hypothetical protein [Bdellovibrionales bacterium]